MSILQTRSRKMTATQALLNSRTGGGAGGAATTAPATASPSGGFTGYSKNIPSILLVIAGVVVFFVGVYNAPMWSNPSPARVGSWSQSRWLALLILWGVAAALVALNAEKATAKTLQTVLAGIAVAALVVFPLWGWVTSPSVLTPKRAVAGSKIQLWTKLVLPPERSSSDIQFPVGTHPVIDGDDVSIHYKYRDGRECVSEKKEECPNGDIPILFFSNRRNVENTFSYTFVRK